MCDHVGYNSGTVLVYNYALTGPTALYAPEDQRKFELMCKRQKEAAILHASFGHRNPTSLVKDLKAAGIPIKHLQRYLHAHKCKYVSIKLMC